MNAKLKEPISASDTDFKSALLSHCTNEEEVRVANLSEEDVGNTRAARMTSEVIDGGLALMKTWLELHGRVMKENMKRG